MMKIRFFKQAFVLLFIIAIFHISSVVLYLYWTIWWADMLLHFLSGVCVAIGGVSTWFIFFESEDIKKDKHQSKILWTGLLAVLIIGILWEFFELYFDITFVSDGINYYSDTSSDILMDISGGILGILYINKSLKKS